MTVFGRNYRERGPIETVFGRNYRERGPDVTIFGRDYRERTVCGCNYREGTRRSHV